MREEGAQVLGNLHLERTAAGLTLSCDLIPMGGDCVVCVSSRPGGHVGSAALAVSRPSLTGTGQSATTSTLNRTGHKDDQVANHMAEAIAREKGCCAVCVCGIHADGLSPEGIAQVLSACRDLEEALLRNWDPDRSDSKQERI